MAPEGSLSASGNRLVVYLFALSLCAGTWLTTEGVAARAAWLAVLALAFALWKWPFPLDPPPVGAARISVRDVVLAGAVSLPVAVNLAATWRGEFPTGGDQFLHNGYALEAYAFWWPWPFLLALAAIAGVLVAVRRNPRSPWPVAAFAGLTALAMIGISAGFPERYPPLLHFLSIPLRVILPVPTAIDVERLLNALSLPVWLLVLRPRLVGRRVDAFALTVGALLYWQKDVVYYVTSGYLEPWTLVLLLTAGEHLVRFGRQAIWRPLLLLGAAALIKDQAFLTLPAVAVVFVPRRGFLPYAATVAAAAAPFLLYASHAQANARRGSAFVPLARAMGEHAALWLQRVQLQFGIALPVVAAGVLALLVLAFRNRGAAALAIAAILDAGIFFFAAVQQSWTGYPRTGLVPLAYAALALGLLVERLPWRTVAIAAVGAVAALNTVPLAPFLNHAFGPSDARNFFEHSDAPIYYPFAEALSRVPQGTTVEFLDNGSRIFPLYYPGLFAEEYPALARRYRVRVGSFRGMTERCGCSGDVTKIAVFIRFANLGSHLPERRAIEEEAAQCRARMAATCPHRMPIVHDGKLVAWIGSAR